jgi:hypothetical protein
MWWCARGSVSDGVGTLMRQGFTKEARSIAGVFTDRHAAKERRCLDNYRSKLTLY